MIQSALEAVVVETKSGALELGPLRSEEREPLFAIFADVVARGDGYPHAPPLTWSVFEETWVRPVSAVVAARRGGELVGAYYLKPNGPGRVAHVANAGYLVERSARSAGIGRALVADSVERAPLLGFDAIQFNLVFSSNPARALYEELGWQQIGRVPAAVDGEDAIIYWRSVAT